jgi:antitoxin CptB
MVDGEASAGDRGRLRWRCRRGMKELDRLLTAYLEQQFESATPQQQNGFRELLELQDPEIYAYCLGRARPASAELADLIDRITHSVPAT